MCKFGIIGVGNMGQAILKSLIEKANIKPHEITVFDIDTQKLQKIKENFNINIADNIKITAKNCKYIFLVVKPKDYKNVLYSIKGVIKKDTVVISSMAGIRIKSIKEYVNNPVVRIMPNTPMLIGEGAIGVSFDDKISKEDKKYLTSVFEKLGETVFVEESLLDVITGLSGSGPAYVFVFLDAMAQGGVKMGLSYSQALRLAVQTVIGSAKMIKELDQHPCILRDMVTSPSGTTIYGLHQLEKKSFKDAIISAVEEAVKRSKQLSKD